MVGRLFPGVPGKQISVFIKYNSFGYIRFFVQLAQDLGGGVGVKEQQGRDGILANNSCQGIHFAFTCVFERSDIIQHKKDTAYQRYNKRCSRLDNDQFVFYRQIFKPAHVIL
jgi:hypothetical protein